MKECRLCRESFPIDSYFKHKGTRDGRVHECKDCMNAIARKARRDRPDVAMLSRARRRAKSKGLEFNITLKDFNIPDRCPVLGIKLEINSKPHQHSSPSLDRIDSTKGYIKGNVVVVSNRANYIKSDATIEELVNLAKYYGA